MFRATSELCLISGSLEVLGGKKIKKLKKHITYLSILHIDRCIYTFLIYFFIPVHIGFYADLDTSAHKTPPSANIAPHCESF